MVPFAFLVLGGVCIAVLCVVFSMLSASACFGALFVYFAVCAFALLALISSFASSLPTISNTTAARICATGVQSCFGGWICDFFG